MKLISKLIKLSFLLFFLFVQQSWSQTDWTIEQLTNTDERESYVVTDVDNEGNVHVAYEQKISYRHGKTVINEERVYYTTKNNGQWTTPVELREPNNH